ncbi:hypothetical protein Q3G72_031354 [Acer saccharum]|nr:hypothetical protein Q3G72_031354 [Acer saccharum]
MFGPWLLQLCTGDTIAQQHLDLGAQPPSWRHLFGTDIYGRDLLVRVLAGGQISLATGLFGAFVAASVGTLYGAIAGFAGGRIDGLMMRLVDIIDALPYMFLVIVLVTLFGKSLILLFVALGLVGWLLTARIVRAQMLALKEREFVLAARALGASRRRLLCYHLLPNTLGPIIVSFTLSVPSMVMQEAFLSFLGLGVQAPRPSLGSLISEGAASASLFWWQLAFPACFLAALSVAQLHVAVGPPSAATPIVRGVDLQLEKGRSLGLVGESGSGKSMLSLALMGLLPKPAAHITQGSIYFEGQDIAAASETSLRRLRGNRIAMIFQDPMTALNPYLTCATQLVEVLQTHQNMSRQAARQRAIQALIDVGISDAGGRIDAYPHMFSGGMRQRVMIAMALLCEPAVLIADEPTTALDVTVQAQILHVLKRMQRAHNTAVLFISHDLRVVASQAERIAVMYAGRIVEEAAAQTLFHAPKHPYARGLLDCMPKLGADASARLTPISGQPPDPRRRPLGCAFHPRCPRMLPVCQSQDPPLVAVSPTHQLACHNPLPAKTLGGAS